MEVKAKLNIRKISHEKRLQLIEEIIHLRNEKRTFEEIAEKLNFISTKSLRCFCKTNEIGTTYERNCKICGKCFSTNISKKVTCSEMCKNENKAQIMVFKRKKPETFVKCLFCNKEFSKLGNRKKYCSIECSRSFRGNKRNILKRINGECDESITLYEVYRKGNGKCYLCGKKVDWGDKKPSNRTMICGPDYPNIDHVIPLKNGGTHTWDNVKLACKYCNSRKKAMSVNEYMESYPK